MVGGAYCEKRGPCAIECGALACGVAERLGQLGARNVSKQSSNSLCAALVHEWLWRIARIGWPWLSDGSMDHDPRMKSRVHPKYKTKYRVGNWAEYDQALVHRGPTV